MNKLAGFTNLLRNKKKYLLIIPLLLGMATSVFAARTDNYWNDYGTWLQTTSPTGYNLLINGVSKYLNFNTLSGSSGYGFRDNSGTIQWKNSGGSWQNIGTGGGGSGGSNWSTTTPGVLYPIDTSLKVVIGDSATTTNDQFQVIGGTYTDTLKVGTLTGYIKGSTGVLSATTTVPYTDLTGTPDLTGYALKATTITAGTGLTGGGDLSANRTLTLDMAGGSCSAGNHINSLSATGTISCSADSGGISSLNGLTGATQTFATGTTGTDFGISSVGTTHTFNLPTSSATNRGLLSSTDWSTFNGKISLNSLSANAPLSYDNGTGAFSLATSSLNHNSLFGLQGGTTNEYYHLTSLEHATATQASSGSQDGYLSKGDWTTFNSKLSTTTWGGIGGTLSNQTDLQSALNGKQDTLVSGTNIKTVNGATMLGSGDLGTITVPYGGTGTTTLTGLIKGNGASAFTAASNGTDYTLLSAQSCSAGYHISALTASGGSTCSADSGGGGVSSLNSLTGGLNLLGTARQITVSPSGTDITLALPQNLDSTSTPTFSTVNGLSLQANADGFQVSGGTTSRTLKLQGENITMTGSGTNTYTYPVATSTLLGVASVGTSGQILQSSGAGVLPTWTTVAGSSRWTTWNYTSFSNVNTLTSTSTLATGTPIRMSSDNSTWVYDIISNMPSANNFTLLGAIATSSYTYFQYGNPEYIETQMFLDNGAWTDNSTTTLFADDLLMIGGYQWRSAPAYLVGFYGTVGSVDTGANKGRLNFYKNGSAISTLNSNAGIEPLTTSVNSTTTVSTSNYLFNYGDTLEMGTDANGSNDNSYNLKATAIFVKP